ncbi:MAG: hypothetical protein M3680_00200 [Myxococcota bacterium]|nr:hypothetical protein [Myxococcota bacterium]
MAAVYKYAASISRRVAAHTRQRDPLSIDDRVQAAIAGTLEGRLTWSPDRIDLGRHLMSVIKTEFTHEARHAKQFPHVSIDDDKNTDDLDAQVTDVLAAQRATSDDDAIAARLSETLAQLRILTAQDESVLLLLEAFSAGYTEKPDVMKVTSMSSRTYHNARQRLVRLAKKLPIEVREAAIHAIT